MESPIRRGLRGSHLDLTCLRSCQNRAATAVAPKLRRLRCGVPFPDNSVAAGPRAPGMAFVGTGGDCGARGYLDRRTPSRFVRPDPRLSPRGSSGFACDVPVAEDTVALAELPGHSRQPGIQLPRRDLPHGGPSRPSGGERPAEDLPEVVAG